MPSYETLDAIADSYIPVLAFIALASPLLRTLQLRWQLAGLQLLAFVHVALVGYGLMLLDNYFHLWPAVGLDYSTHTALALGLVAALCFNLPKLIVLWLISLVGYVLLMLYQEYHTLADILTTGLAVGLLVVPGMLGLHRCKGSGT